MCSYHQTYHSDGGNRLKKFLLLGSVMSILFCAACSDTEEDLEIKEESSITDSEKKEDEEVEANKEQKEETPVESDNLQIGDSATINDITVTINKAYLTDERNDNNLIDVSGVLILEVTYENNSNEVFPTGRDIIVESNGELAHSYDLENTLLEDIQPGESIEGRMAYGLENEPEDLTATFEPLINNEGESAIFDIKPDTK